MVHRQRLGPISCKRFIAASELLWKPRRRFLRFTVKPQGADCKENTMKPIRMMAASATALTIALGGPSAAQPSEGSLPPGQMMQLMRALETLCETPDTQPNTLNCTLVTAAASNPSLEPQILGMVETMSDEGVTLPGLDLEQFLGRADQPAEAAPETAEAEVEAETSANDDTTAEVEPKTTAEAEALADAEASPANAGEPAAEAQTEAETLAQNADTAEAEPAEPAQSDSQTAETLAESEGGNQEQSAEANSETEAPTEPEVAELDPQAQADALAASETSSAAAAVASGDTDNASTEARQETVTEDSVRQSTEDFETDVTQAPEAEATAETEEARKADDDESGIDPIIAGGIAAFGAAVLADILSGDDEVVSNSGDRVVVENNGQFRVLRNDDVLLRRPGAEITTYEYNDGSTRNVVAYEDGTVVETIRAGDGRVLRRSRTLQDGTTIVLFDDTQGTEQVVVNDLPQTSDAGTRTDRVVYEDGADSDALARALAAQDGPRIDRRFSLNQVRNIDRVRYLVPDVSVSSINFQTNSAAIRPEEAEELRALGNAMRDFIERNPAEVFLIEGHTDAVGNYAYNLALSDRRAESVALALTEYFDVPPENMVLQGYGESDLLIETFDAERANRRAAVRRITPLLQGG